MFEVKSNERIREADLILPALVVLAQAKRFETGGVALVDLERDIGTVMPLRSVDMEVTPGDKVTRYQRTVRNLNSHQTLVKMGVAEVVAGPEPSYSYLSITPAGMNHLFKHMVAMFDSHLPSLETLKAGEPHIKAVPGNERIGEAKLKEVALLVLGILENKGEGAAVEPTVLRRGIKALSGVAFEFSEADIEMLPSRPGAKADTRIDQVLRNMIGSNKTLTRTNYAERVDSGLRLTDEGRAHVVMDDLLGAVPPPPSVRKALAALQEAAPQPADVPAPRRSGPRP